MGSGSCSLDFWLWVCGLRATCSSINSSPVATGASTGHGQGDVCVCVCVRARMCVTLASGSPPSLRPIPAEWLKARANSPKKCLHSSIKDAYSWFRALSCAGPSHEVAASARHPDVKTNIFRVIRLLPVLRVACSAIMANTTPSHVDYSGPVTASERIMKRFSKTDVVMSWALGSTN